MQLQGTVDIKADRETVFAFLTDPDRIGPCLPKVESNPPAAQRSLRGHREGGKGFISASFVLDCAFTELVAPDRAAIRATGKAKGSAVDGTAQMILRDLPSGGTAVDWTADITISGLVAKLGEGRLRSGADRIITQTFKRVRKQLKA